MSHKREKAKSNLLFTNVSIKTYLLEARFVVDSQTCFRLRIFSRTISSSLVPAAVPARSEGKKSYSILITLLSKSFKDDQ